MTDLSKVQPIVTIVYVTRQSKIEAGLGVEQPLPGQ